MKEWGLSVASLSVDILGCSSKSWGDFLKASQECEGGVEVYLPLNIMMGGGHMVASDG